ncbi:MAG: flagellar hook-length control protein FliK, partial [Planctomycetes bacterium]|nr:flagellar hook-length control protein FliK [Planctomycetota bacterium]
MPHGHSIWCSSLFVALLGASCSSDVDRGSGAPEEIGKTPTAAVPTTAAPMTRVHMTRVQFEDVTQRVGLDFEHTSGTRDQPYILESMSAGGAFLDYDGVVVFAGAFEEIQNRDYMDPKVVCMVPADLDRREREFFTTVEKGKIFIFLVSNLPHIVRFHTVSSTLDLFRRIAHIFDLDWECLNKPFPLLTTKAPEFKDYLSRYGTGYLTFNWIGDKDSFTPLFVGSRSVFGLAFGNKVFFVPCTYPETHEDIIETAKAAIDAALRYRTRTSKALPEWVASFVFGEEASLRDKLADLHKEIAVVEQRLDQYTALKGALCFQSDPLVEVITSLLDRFFDISITVDEKFIEDATLFDENVTSELDGEEISYSLPDGRAHARSVVELLINRFEITPAQGHSQDSETLIPPAGLFQALKALDQHEDTSENPTENNSELPDKITIGPDIEIASLIDSVEFEVTPADASSEIDSVVSTRQLESDATFQVEVSEDLSVEAGFIESTLIEIQPQETAKRYSQGEDSGFELPQQEPETQALFLEGRTNHSVVNTAKGTEQTDGTRQSVSNGPSQVQSQNSSDLSVGEIPEKDLSGKIKSSTKQTSIRSEANPKKLVNRVASAIQSAGRNGRLLRIRLQPPELGTLEIEVSSRNGVLSARLEVQTASSQQAILAHMSLLRG